MGNTKIAPPDYPKGTRGQADLTGLGPTATANQAGVADGVVGGAKGAVAHQGFIGVKLVGHRLDAGHVQGFLDGHPGQNTRHQAGNEGFTRSGRAAHQHVVAASVGDF